VVTRDVCVDVITRDVCVDVITRDVCVDAITLGVFVNVIALDMTVIMQCIYGHECCCVYSGFLLSPFLVCLDMFVYYHGFSLCMSALCRVGSDSAFPLSMVLFP
jgi:hypothetical protein